MFQWRGICSRGRKYVRPCCRRAQTSARRAAPDVVVALAFALGLSVVSAAGLALVLRDLQADVAFSAHVGEHRGLRRDRRLRRGAAPLDPLTALFLAISRAKEGSASEWITRSSQESRTRL